MADTGWLNPTTTNLAWTNSNNVFAQDGANATGTGAGAGETPFAHAYAFTGLAAALASASTIDGIQVDWWGARTAGTLQYDYTHLRKDVTTTTIQSITAQGIGLAATATAYVTSGGATNLWGGRTGGPWIQSDFNDTTFGIVYAFAGNAGITIALDHVRLKVFYTPVAGGSGGKWWWNGWGT